MTNKKPLNPPSPPTYTERLEEAAAALRANGTLRRSEISALVAGGWRVNAELARAEAVIAAVRELYAAWPSLESGPLPDAVEFRAWVHEHARGRLARMLNFYAAGGGLA